MLNQLLKGKKHETEPQSNYFPCACLSSLDVLEKEIQNPDDSVNRYMSCTFYNFHANDCPRNTTRRNNETCRGKCYSPCMEGD